MNNAYCDEIELEEEQFVFVLNRAMSVNKKNFITLVNSEKDSERLLQKANLPYIEYKVSINKTNPMNKDLLISNNIGAEQIKIENINQEKISELLDNIPNNTFLLVKGTDVFPERLLEEISNKLNEASKLKNVLFEYKADKNVPMVLQVRSLVLKMKSKPELLLDEENKVKVKM